MIRSAVFVLCGLLAATMLNAQSAVNQPASAAETRPLPLLPPEGFDDGHGYVLPGVDWAHAAPESEGFSPGSKRCALSSKHIRPTE